MTSTIEHTTVDAAVKAKHRALWASGDYPRVATELIPQLGPALVEAAGVRRGSMSWMSPPGPATPPSPPPNAGPGWSPRT